MVKYNKTEGRGPTLEETWPVHAIRSSVAIIKLLLGRDILKKNKKNNKNGEMQFFENDFSQDFF